MIKRPFYSISIRIENYLRRSLYNILYLCWLKLDYFKVVDNYRFMKKNQYQPIEHNISIQKERLYNIINFSMKYVPYYNIIAEEKNITISKESIFEDIKKFPVLTKEIIRKNGKFFLPRSIQSKYRLNTSGGTTGEPLIFIQDQNYILNGIAATQFIDEIGGYYLGDKLIMLWGSAADIFKNTKGFLKLFIKIDNLT